MDFLNIASIQEFAEVIKSILQIDVTIIDLNLKRIAATGAYKNLIGEQLPNNCAYAYILKNKTFEFVEKLNFDNRCYNCEFINNCEELLNIGYPILNYKGDAIGVIGLIAFTDIQRNKIKENFDNINLFLDKISSLISVNLNYEKTINSLYLKNNEINNIINSLDDGIIIVNSDLAIKNINNKAKELLNFKNNDFFNFNIKDLFDNLNIDYKDEQYIKLNKKFNVNSDEFIVKIIENNLSNAIDKKSYIIKIKKYTTTIINAYNFTEKTNISFEDILGSSSSLKNTITLAKQVASGNSSILIRGESGTGKELFARAIHSNSKNKNNQFVAINCSSIPDNLLESELFGYEKGAFSGANDNGKIGKLELANEGTLFLDEIGDLPIHLQPKLLRVLQDGTFSRLGSNKIIKTNFRLISATNRNLEDMILSNEFREDLYYRLNVIPIDIIPLRERKEDIPIICNFKVKEYCEKLNKESKYLSNSLIDIFLNYHWPGNIRELENIIEYLVNVSNDIEISISDLPNRFLNLKKNNQNNLDNYILTNNNDFFEEKSLKELTKNYEKYIIQKMINKYGDSTEDKEKISKILKVNISTLYRKMY